MNEESVYYAMAKAYLATASMDDAIARVVRVEEHEDWSNKFLEHLWRTIDAYEDLTDAELNSYPGRR